MAVVALINLDAGSVPSDADTSLREHLGRGLTHLVTCDSPTLLSALGDLGLSDGDTLIAWGGDGTVAAALNSLAGTKAAILPLPGGTMNLIHKRIHRHRTDWRSVLDGALNAPPASITYGVANERRFFVAIMLGRLIKLSDAREALRDGAPIEAARTAVAQDALDLETALGAHFGGKCTPATAASAFLPEDLSGAHFDIGLIDPDSLVELASTGLSALLFDWRSADGVSFHLASDITFTGPGDEPLRVLLDGEPCELDPPACVSLRCGDAWVKSADPAR